MNNHGGNRKGAGRPLKWPVGKVIEVGQACEKRWLEASRAAIEARSKALYRSEEIDRLQREVQKIPVKFRKEWLKSQEHEEHIGDLESWLHNRAGTTFDDNTAEFETDAPRVFSIPTKPFRGTRTRIISEVASIYMLPKKTVDNLWQSYRRLVQ